MKNYPIINRVTVMENPMSIFEYFGWPSVCRLSDGRLAAAASGFRYEHICPFGKAVLSFSADEGRSWTPPVPVIDTVLDDRDAGIVPLGGSRVMVTSFNNTLVMQRKINDTRRADPDPYVKEHYPPAYLDMVDSYLAVAEKTGLESSQLGSTYRISEDNCTTFGPLFRSPVTCPHGPCVTNDGRIIYVGHPFDDSAHPAEDPTLQCWELDGKGGAVFLSKIPMVEDEFGPFGELCEPYTVCLPDGTLLVHIRVERREPRVFTIWQSESLDGGRSFSTPHPIAEPTAGAPAHILQRSNGELISTAGVRTPGIYGITVFRSRDGGKSWSSRPLITDAPDGDLGYPASVELANGNIFTLWYQHPDASSPAVIMGAEWDPDSPD